MITVKIADLTVRMKNRYRYVELLCRDYVTDDEAVDFEVEATEAEISEEIKNAECEANSAYAEAICLHRHIAEQLWRFDCFLLHSALIACDGQGLAFAARSGVGKSTHIGLWQKNFGERVRVINGDKPIVRITKDGVLAYGTPWNGKEGLGENSSCSMKGVCFLMRGNENEIHSVSTEEAAMRLFTQVYLPKDTEAIDKTLSLLDEFVNRISFWELRCNMEDEAALLSHRTMTGV